MHARSWLNRLHPQTLLSATMLLYIEGLFNLVRGPFLAMVGAAMFPAAWGLAKMGRGLEISPEVETDLAHANPSFQKKAMEILGVIRDTRRVFPLKEGLMWSGSDPLKKVAARTLGRIGGSESVEALKAAYPQVGSMDLKLEIVEALAGIALPEAREALRGILERAEYAELRIRVLRGLGLSGDLGQIRALRPHFVDPNPEVRMEAARGALRLIQVGAQDRV